jgi:hypothetical protein
MAMARFLAAFLIATTITFGLVTFSNAETQIYDANGQYVGILVPTLNYGNIYIPSLDLITGFTDQGDIIEIPVSMYYEYQDCKGDIFSPIILRVQPPNRLLRDPCSNDLLVTSQMVHFDKVSYKPNQPDLEYPCDCTNYPYSQSTDLMRLVPFDESSLPFTLPLAMPLEMVYTKPVIPGRPPDKGPPKR